MIPQSGASPALKVALSPSSGMHGLLTAIFLVAILWDFLVRTENVIRERPLSGRTGPAGDCPEVAGMVRSRS